MVFIVPTLNQMWLIEGEVLSAKLKPGVTRRSRRHVPRVELQQEAKNANRPNAVWVVVSQWVFPAAQRVRTRATIQSWFYRLLSTRPVCDHNVRRQNSPWWDYSLHRLSFYMLYAILYLNFVQNYSLKCIWIHTERYTRTFLYISDYYDVNPDFTWLIAGIPSLIQHIRTIFIIRMQSC